MKKNISSLVLSAFLVLGLISCSTTNLRTMPHVPDIGMDTSVNLPVEYLCPSELQWTPLMNDGEIIEGFQIMSYELKDLKVRWSCVKADLTTPDLQIVATPIPEELGKSPTLQHVKKFAKKHNAIVAVNATPWKNKSYPNDAVGIVKIDGVEYFPPVENYCAICFSKEPLRAKIIQYQDPEEIKKFDYAFGGFSQVLKDSELISFNKSRRSRVAMGTNSDGSQLYFFVVTSIMTPNDRNGFTFEECGMVLKELGCTDVMHFDGGHSSCLVVNGKDFEKPLLNRKIPIAIGLKK